MFAWLHTLRGKMLIRSQMRRQRKWARRELDIQFKNMRRQATLSKRADGEVIAGYLDRRFRYVALIGSWTLITALALGSMCCAHPVGVRSVAQEHESAVMISGMCRMETTPGLVQWVEYPRGSAVQISATQYLTAFHVVDDAECDYFITDDEGNKSQVRVENVWAQYDVARLQIPGDSPMHYNHKVRVGKVPAAGKRICVVSAIPSPTRRCGEVQLYKSKLPGNINHSAIVEPGNSGSGVYDDAGRLVGITTHLLRCVNGQICGGKFTSLEREFFQ